MSWMDWGIVAGIISMVAVLLFAILTIYAGPRGASPTNNRLGITSKPEPLIQGRAS